MDIIGAAVMNNKESFIQYMQSIKQNFDSQNYKSYIDKKLDTELEQIVLKISNKNLFEINDISELDKLSKILNKKNPQWHEYSYNKNSHGIPNAIIFTHYKNFLKRKSTSNIIKQRSNEQILNLILYGPPGTGKTYNTVIKAIEIIKPNCIKYNEKGDVINYSDVKKEFDKAKDNHQIEFVTFHQSYSYEEFVEGIKPDLSSDDLKYVLEDGIFKNICEHAEVKFSDNFDKIYGNFLEEVSSSEGLFKLKTRKYKKEFGLEINSNNNLNIYMGNDFHKQGTLTKENIQRHFLQTRTQSDWSGYYDGIIDYLQDKYYLKKQDKKIQPYILIIDEINRGNISKIFGELITLIEEDKRENMAVKLPYSQETFTVPKNLYIIGTMNTSDRSIASIDIALRRRFKFKEMMPDSNLVADFDIGFNTIFDDLNNKIKLLLDRDHQIGHSYFINTKYNNNNGNNNVETLKDIWFSEILPLLNEYFYCDWEKLKLIVPGFIRPLKIPPALKSECDDSIYEFKTFDEVSDFEKALNQEKFEQA